MPEMLLDFSIFNIKMATQKFTSFDKILFVFFLMHTDMTSVTIQSNKIVSNEVKDSYSQLTGGKKEWTFWPTQYFPGFRLNKCSFVLHKGVKQWSLDMPPSSSVSDSMRASSGSSGSGRDARRWLALHSLSGRLANRRDWHTQWTVKCHSVQCPTVPGLAWQLWGHKTKTKMSGVLPWDW